MRKYVGPGKVHLRGWKNRASKERQVLWGDVLLIDEVDGDWYGVKWGKVRYWIRAEDCMDSPLLEVIFLDVGQGDSCMVTTPDEESRVLVIDAGVGSNTRRFLDWRYGKVMETVQFEAAVMTHPDKDHYNGFKDIFNNNRYAFNTVYHNGLIERTGENLLGASDDTGFLIEVALDARAARKVVGNAALRGSKLYPKLLHTALGRGFDVRMLSTTSGEAEGGRTYMPGFSPSAPSGLSIEVLGPVVEPDSSGAPRLRWFGDKVGDKGRNSGKTKNGHSVLLRLRYNGFTLLFGGDLNSPAEDFLLRHYGKKQTGPLRATVPRASKRFSSDMMKSCHHGSADVTDEFLQAVGPFAFVVSSGDQESHAHPRPDLLGRLGRFGRGDSPLILCTELLRSTRETEDPKLLRRIRVIDNKLEDVTLTADERKTLIDERNKKQDELARRNVEVYGAITVRTDGERLAVAFRLEKAGKLPTSNPSRKRNDKRWKIYWFRSHPEKGWLSDGEI